MNQLKKLTFYFDFLVILALGVIKGPWLQPDSGGYLADYNMLRSPLYPLLLKGYKFIFGDELMALVVIQSIFGWLIIHYVSKKLIELFFEKKGDVSLFHSLVCRLILAIPYLFFLDIGRAVLTEAVCYPLFLLVMWFGFNYIKGQKKSDLWKTMGILTLLILTKRQFLFVYPLLCIMAFYLFLYKKYLPAVMIVASCIMSFFATNYLESSYNYYHIKKFSTVPFIGMQTVNAPLFVTKKEDILKIKNVREREFVMAVKDLLLENKMSPYNAEVGQHFIDIPPYYRFYGAYNPICFHFVPQVMAEKKYGFDAHSRDKFLVDVTLTLIKINPLEYARVLFQNVVNGLGDYFGTLLVLILAALSNLKLLCSAYCGRQINPRMLWLSFVSLAVLGNISLVTLVELTQVRYIFFLAPIWVVTLLGFIVPGILEDNINKKSN